MPAPAFPTDFLLGCATAAHQVEGGIDNDWAAWASDDPARIADRSDATVACDHYARYRDDLGGLAALHNNAHRFSIEWARVEPRPGWFDLAALDHYADVVRTCRHLGMEPLVTLHHFTLPRWIAAGGGVLHPRLPALFARYVAACVQHLGGDVAWWITVNEPAVLAFMGYLFGTWPPGARSPRRLFAALRATARMHAAAATAIRAVSQRNGWTARISIAHNERPQRAGPDATLADRVVAGIGNWIFNRWFLASTARGRLLPPVGRGERVPGLHGSLDYLGVNYYAEDLVAFDIRSASTGFVRQFSDPGLPTSSFAWSIDPPVFRRTLNALWREFRLPIVVTENGVADANDELRPAYIVDHLGAVLDAIRDGVDVRGYLHWTAWDNFEWAEGYTKKFGLFSVDRTTLDRIPKPSAALYAEICRTRTLPPAS